MLCAGFRIGLSFRIFGESNVTLSENNDFDSDGFLGHSRRHRWYPKTATPAPGVKSRTASFLQLLEATRKDRSCEYSISKKNATGVC